MSAEPGRKTSYSVDIGWRVVWQPCRCSSRRLQIASSTAHRIFKRFEEGGDVSPAKQPSRLHARKLNDHHELLIIAIVIENPSVYLREVCTMIKEVSGTEVSGSTVCRLLRRSGKKIQVAKQRSVEYRAAFMAQVLQYDPEYFVWVDESGNHIRKFGYALFGLAAVYHRFLSRGKRISAIAAISSEGVELTTGSVNPEQFLDFVHGTLIPEMQPLNLMVQRKGQK